MSALYVLGSLRSRSLCSSPTPSAAFRSFSHSTRTARPSLDVLRSSFRPPTAPKCFSVRSFSTSNVSRAIRDSYYRGTGTGRSGGRGSYGYTGRGGGGGKRAPWDRLSAKQIVYGIIGANVAVCGVWQIAWMKYSNFNEAPMLVWMRKNWALSLGNLKEGRIWTLFTSTFSHEAPLHLLFNMVIVYQFAPQIISSIGNARFLALYAFAGVAGNVASALTRTIWPKAPGVGASGSMFGLTAFTAAAMPSLELLLFFVVPVNARYALAGWSLFELVSEVYWQGNRTIDGAAHLGGIAAGLIFYRKVMRGKF